MSSQFKKASNQKRHLKMPKKNKIKKGENNTNNKCDFFILAFHDLVRSTKLKQMI